MLKIKVNQKDIEIIESEEFVRGTVGAKCIVGFDEYWNDEEALMFMLPIDPEMQKFIDADFSGLKACFVFKRYDMQSIQVPLFDYHEEITSLTSVLSANNKAKNNDDEHYSAMDIPHEVLRDSGSFKIGFFMSLYYVYKDSEGKLVEGVGTTPTLWSDTIKVHNGTDTDGTTATQYTPTELEQLNSTIAKKQDKLVAGENVTITDGNVISATVGDADQTYKSNSSNAQSGKAVAEAIDKFDKNNHYVKAPYTRVTQQSEHCVSTFLMPEGMGDKYDYAIPSTYKLEYINRNLSEQAACIPIRNNGELRVPYIAGFNENKDSEYAAAFGELKYVRDQLSNTITNLDTTLTPLVNAKTITTVGVVAGCKYTFDWNAMYFLKSNTGKTDITLLDSDGNNIIGSLKCSYGLLILPKTSYTRSEWTSKYDPSNPAYDDGKVYEDGNRKEDKLHGLFAGYTDKTAIVTTDKIQMLQFDLDPDKTVSVTPTAESVIVYKIKF